MQYSRFFWRGGGSARRICSVMIAAIWRSNSWKQMISSRWPYVTHTNHQTSSVKPVLPLGKRDEALQSNYQIHWAVSQLSKLRGQQSKGCYAPEESCSLSPRLFPRVLSRWSPQCDSFDNLQLPIATASFSHAVKSLLQVSHSCNSGFWMRNSSSCSSRDRLK